MLANSKAKQRMFKMTRADENTRAFSFPNKRPEVLDLCIAPGGFLAHFLEKIPFGFADGITLPGKEGGHPVLIHFDKDSRVHV